MRKPTRAENRLAASEKVILRDLRLAFRNVAGKADPDRIGKLTVLAFRLEFPHAKTENALANAYVRAIPSIQKMLTDEGGSVDASNVANRLGIAKTTVLRRYRQKRLVGWRDYYGAEVRFPRWQFTKSGLLPGIEEVMAVFRDANCVSDLGIVLFFVSQFDALDGQRPLDRLREGHVNEVLRIANSRVA